MSDQVSYEVIVFTSESKYAGTHAKVYITLYGERPANPDDDVDHSDVALGPHLLPGSHLTSPPPNNRHHGPNPLRHKFNDIDLEKVSFVQIWHDGTGDYPGWHLDKVTVINESRNEEWTFPCNMWLSDHPRYNPDRKTRRLMDENGVISS
jgi:PLAT/LH2 domain-containing protein